MKLIRAVSCWGNEASPAEALELACQWDFEALEGPILGNGKEFGPMAKDLGKEVFAEIVTGCDSGSYVPRLGATPEEHLEDFRRKLDQALEAEPLRITTLAGTDFWDFSTACGFFEKLLEIAVKAGVEICVETHRARPTFHPLRTARLLEELPGLILTLDISHWCVVCERLMPSEEAWMWQIEGRVGHVHARVGYDQGPQVPDPRSPRYEAELDAHLSCWRRIAGHLHGRGAETMTITPEFGPDGYLQSHPLDGSPVADLREINRWMGDKLVQSGIGKV